MDVATATLPTYRSRVSKHQFTQPQLLAKLCLMRYEDWTLREAEVRLREHAELRAVLRLSSVPDYSTVYRFLQRLPDDTIESALGESVRRRGGCPPCFFDLRVTKNLPLGSCSSGPSVAGVQERKSRFLATLGMTIKKRDGDLICVAPCVQTVWLIPFIFVFGIAPHR
jgi:hypothetical protein